MRKMLALLAALMMVLTSAAAEKTDDVIIGGADAVTSIILNSTTEPVFGSVTLVFDANTTTGYEWTGFVIGGDSAEIDPDGSGYVSDASTDSLKCGVGGKHYFKINALQPGESVIRFTYARSWEDEPLTTRYILVVVEDDLLIYTMDITDSGVYDGVVTEVNAEDHSVMLNTDRMGEVVARFEENETLPVQDEHIMVYTNGTMTMSLPAIVNVIGWSSIPSDAARE